MMCVFHYYSNQYNYINTSSEDVVRYACVYEYYVIRFFIFHKIFYGTGIVMYFLDVSLYFIVPIFFPVHSFTRSDVYV